MHFVSNTFGVRVSHLPVSHEIKGVYVICTHLWSSSPKRWIYAFVPNTGTTKHIKSTLHCTQSLDRPQTTNFDKMMTSPLNGSCKMFCNTTCS